MNMGTSFGALGNYGMVPYGSYGRPKRGKKKGKGKGEKTARRRLFRQFAREYGTKKFPAVNQERADCIRAWLRDKEREGCKKVVGEMRQFEYLDWLKQGLRSGKLKGAQARIAQSILGRGKEEEPVHKKRGDIDEETGEVVEGDGPPVALILGGLVLAGGLWWFTRKGKIKL